MMNEMIENKTNEMMKQLSPEVLQKYGWLVLATPAAIHISNKIYEYFMAKEAMKNNYMIVVDNEKSEVRFTKTAIVS